MALLRSFIVVLLVFLIGCTSTPKGPGFSEVGNEPDNAVVYIYRLHMPPYARKPDIKVGDVVVAELPTDSYTVIRLRPGTYTIKTDWGLLDNTSLGKSATLSVSAGKSYYVNFASKSIFLLTTAAISAYVLSGELAGIPPDLASCEYVAPRVSLLGSQ